MASGVRCLTPVFGRLPVDEAVGGMARTADAEYPQSWSGCAGRIGGAGVAGRRPTFSAATSERAATAVPDTAAKET